MASSLAATTWVRADPRADGDANPDMHPTPPLLQPCSHGGCCPRMAAPAWHPAWTRASPAVLLLLGAEAIQHGGHIPGRGRPGG